MTNIKFQPIILCLVNVPVVLINSLLLGKTDISGIKAYIFKPDSSLCKIEFRQFIFVYILRIFPPLMFT